VLTTPTKTKNAKGHKLRVGRKGERGNKRRAFVWGDSQWLGSVGTRTRPTRKKPKRPEHDFVQCSRGKKLKMAKLDSNATGEGQKGING